LLVADFVAWPKTSPAPQNRSSIRLWNRFNSEQSKTIEHELYPLSIVVHGDLAIAHYVYTQATEDRKKEVTVANGRFTDVLVRDDNTWRFISWHGGDDE
jgi:ketosteroid isomerase-like protein